MLNFSISWWELALIVIAIAFVIGIYFLVKFLRGLIQTLNSVNSFLAENKRSMDNIVENIDDITKDASKITGKADNITNELNSTVTSVKGDVVNPLIQALATLVKMLTTATKRKASGSVDNEE